MDIHIGIDVGGTFTDLALNIPGEDRQLLHKLPSTPDEPARAIIDGIAAILAEHGLDAGNVVRLSHGTTVGTNALIQRQTGRVAVVTTKGFRDLLEIGRQTRPKVYDIHMDNPAPLVPRELRLEVAERMRADGTVHVPLDEDEVARIGRQLAQEHVDCVVVGSILLPALLSVIIPSPFNVAKFPLNAKSPSLKSIPTPIASITPLPT